MRLKINIGSTDTKTITWNSRMDDFPKLFKYLGKPYEWVYYDRDLTGQVDMILHFYELPHYDPNFYADQPHWHEILLGNSEIDLCCCGAKFSSFSWDHMRYCTYWSKW